MKSLQGWRVALFPGADKGKWLLTMATLCKKMKPAVTDCSKTINPEATTALRRYFQQAIRRGHTKNCISRLRGSSFCHVLATMNRLTVTELFPLQSPHDRCQNRVADQKLEVNAFASQTDQTYAGMKFPVTALQGSTSVPQKHLAQHGKITIEVRDRFHSEILILSTPMNSFTDYPSITIRRSHL